MNEPIPPAHRICGRLTNWERDVPNLAHYAAQVGDTRLQKRIARLTTEIDKTLKAARKAAGRDEAFK
ncbi:MAG TPA: hypothetical protein VLK33_23045 [Terriglobales bacterium]|nr:hypothetical protein [Terriglobales bacterium]